MLERSESLPRHKDLWEKEKSGKGIVNCGKGRGKRGKYRLK